MVENILLVFDDFDPVSRYKLSLVKEALNTVDINTVLFLYHKYKVGDRVFRPEEKISLLAASIPKALSPKYLIDGVSFEKETLSIFNKITSQKSKYPKSVLYLLLDSREFELLRNNKNLVHILALTVVILYVLPEHKGSLSQVPLTLKPPFLINPSKELNRLSTASVLNVERDFFDPLVLEYMNKSGECAIKRIKSHLSIPRFKHSLRVAGTVKRITELIELEDEELKYDVYMAALYHDICKELPPEEQKQLAKQLNIHSYPSYKVLHGPIAAWYLKEKYLIEDSDILEAISQHTVPDPNPKLITVLLFLADHLEVGKKDRYPEEVYGVVWDLIEDKKPIEAFNVLISYFDELKKQKS